MSAKKVTAAFDGGRISSDCGVMLLAAARRRLGIAAKLAAAIIHRRDRGRVLHSMVDIARARILDDTIIAGLPHVINDQPFSKL